MIPQIEKPAPEAPVIPTPPAKEPLPTTPLDPPPLQEIPPVPVAPDRPFIAAAPAGSNKPLLWGGLIVAAIVGAFLLIPGSNKTGAPSPAEPVSNSQAEAPAAPEPEIAARSTASAPAATPVAPAATEPGPAITASFDCAKATTWDETAICGSADLASRDVLLAASYKSMMQNAANEADRTALKMSQRAWIRSRGECQFSSNAEQCLAAKFQARTEELQAWRPSGEVPNSDPGASGSIELKNSWQAPDGQKCRSYRETFYRNNQPVNEERVACRNSRGEWVVQ